MNIYSSNKNFLGRSDIPTAPPELAKAIRSAPRFGGGGFFTVTDNTAASHQSMAKMVSLRSSDIFYRVNVP
jgi:hypothetical protein